MTEISQELLERCVALVRGMAEHEPFVTPAQHGKAVSDDYCRAKIIAAEIPAPVDPDLETAKALALEFGWGNVSDKSNIAMVLVTALKRGRELASLARSANA